MNASSAPWSFTPSLTALFYQLGIAFPLFFGAVRRSRTPLTLTLTLALAHDALLTPAHSAPQVLMFSATLHDDEVKRLAGQLCTQPTWVDLKGKDAVPETVDHMVHHLPRVALLEPLAPFACQLVKSLQSRVRLGSSLLNADGCSRLVGLPRGSFVEPFEPQTPTQVALVSSQKDRSWGALHDSRDAPTDNVHAFDQCVAPERGPLGHPRTVRV